MHRRSFLQSVSLAAVSMRRAKANPEPAQHRKWIEIAERLKPRLAATRRTPARLVNFVADKTQFLQWRTEDAGPPSAASARLLRRGDSVIVDFGGHLTGRFSFAIAGEGRGIDAPARIKLTFGEVPGEIAEPFDPYHGTLSRAWLQDEVVNIDVLPAAMRMPRRYAFRYVKIEVIDTSPNYAVRIGEITAESLTSASGTPAPLPADTPALLRRIDEVSIATLRDCMQTVFEDGPKRDRRLWIGDLRLQALTNYATFRNYGLVRRCLYLFAAFPREDGLVPACVFEEPKPMRGHEYIVDYAALYAAAVLDYAQASNDWRTAADLWLVVRRQMEILSQYVTKDGIFQAPQGSWVFIDWNPRLDHTAAMQGVFIYSLSCAAALAAKVGNGRDASGYAALIARMRQAGRAAFLDETREVFVSGPQRQVSWATQAWMVLSGTASPAEGAKALHAMRKLQDAVKPGAPYLYHYVAEAMLQCGLKQDAIGLIESYWGGMVEAGADTFWEVYDPADPLLSPYGNRLVNSYCHAWSCTPAFLLRRAARAG